MPGGWWLGWGGHLQMGAPVAHLYALCLLHSNLLASVPAVGLVDRPWNTAIVFLPPSAVAPSSTPAGSTAGSSGADGSSQDGGAAGSRLLVGTGYHKVRLYDAEAGKRPQMDVAWGEGRVTCLALEPDGERCIARSLPCLVLPASSAMVDA